MKSEFYKRLEKSNAGTNCRNGIRDFVMENKGYLGELIDFSIHLENKNHHKSVWIIEMIAETNTTLLLPYLDLICETIPKYKHESAIRGISRVAFFLGTSKEISLTENQIKKITEATMDWLIGEERVAPKVYAMKTLSYFAEKEVWIEEELKNILTKDYPTQSAGYKAAAREILKKLK